MSYNNKNTKTLWNKYSSMNLLKKINFDEITSITLDSKIDLYLDKEARDIISKLIKNKINSNSNDYCLDDNWGGILVDNTVESEY